MSVNKSKNISPALNRQKPPEHGVKFYHTDSALAEAVCGFFQSALHAGETALLIATPSHRLAIEDQLAKRDFEVHQLQSSGRYIALDAAETLAQFMVDGRPDETLFHQTVGELVKTVLAKSGGLRAFGEMVALLWRDNNREGAIELERCWNNLQRDYSFALLCGYPVQGFPNTQDTEPFIQVCQCHTHVHPSQTLLVEQSAGDIARKIAFLEQRAACLEAEIAQRKKVEEQLRDFLHNATEGIHQVADDGKILWANEAELEMLGYDADEYIGRRIQDFHADQVVIDDIFARLRRHETLHNYEARLKHKDGSIRFVLINSSARFEDGDFAYTKCFTRDITDRKNSELSSELLNAIVASSDDAIVSKDLNGIITSWNAGAQRIFGYTAEEVIGQPVTILMPPERVNEEPGILRRLRNGERIDHYETIRRRKDGSLLNVSLTVSPIKDSNGAVIGASKVARDITERVRAKEKLEQTVAERTSALRDVVAELEAFSYSIAHDMRAPLRAMHGYSQILQDEHAANLSPEALDLLHRIVSSSARLDSLIIDVLNYSRITRGQMELTNVALEDLLHDVLDSYPQLRASGATILIQSPLPAVTANAAALTQVFSNLLSNATKFVAPGVSPKIRVYAHPRESDVRICVVDNGIGIPEAGRKRIFRLFERLNPSTEFEGTGIGLTIVRKAVERMGGRVGVESHHGSGSCFWVDLPAAH
jgi:PAS domain S-box-containing protein